MSDKLILHGMQSPNVIKVILMLEECGLDYELRHTAVFNQAQFTPEFQRLNPVGKVPVLEDPKLGQPLAESGAILFWLAEREGRFLPTRQPARAEVMQWLMVQMANYGPMLGQFTHFNIAPPEHPVERAARLKNFQVPAGWVARPAPWQKGRGEFKAPQAHAAVAVNPNPYAARPAAGD